MNLETVTLSYPIVTVFVLYSLLMLYIGFYFYKKNKSSDDYFIGNKGMGPVISALSAGASDMSGWLMLGLPGAILAYGLGQTYIAIGLSIGALLNWLYMAGRLRSYTGLHDNCITIPDYFQTRFDDDAHILRIICAIVILVFFTVYISSGLVAGAKLFESLFDIRYHNALLTGTTLIMLYTFFGGYKAVCWTDLIQGILMMLALVVVPLVMISQIGGFGETVKIVQEVGAASGKDYLSMSKNLGIISIISSMAWGLGYFGQPHILVRFISIRSVADVKAATTVGIGWMVISLFGAVMIGFIGIAYLQKFSLDLKDPERIFIVMSQLLFNPWISGLLLSAILAAIMSTASSQLLVSSSTLAEDFYRKIFRRDAPQETVLRISRLSVLAVAAVAFFISADQNSKVLSIVAYAWAGFGASFGAVMLVSLFWDGVSRLGAILGMSAGAISVVVWENLPSKEGVFGLYSILPGFAAAILCLLLGSLISPATANMKRKFAQMKEDLAKFK